MFMECSADQCNYIFIHGECNIAMAGHAVRWLSRPRGGRIGRSSEASRLKMRNPTIKETGAVTNPSHTEIRGCGGCSKSSFAPGAIAQPTQQLPAGSTTYPIHFPTCVSKLGAEDLDTIRAVSSKMKNDTHLTATIIGKADTVGSAEFNQRLSEQRAQAAFEALVYSNLLPESRVQMEFTGAHIPFVSTEDEQAESQNRVVALILHQARLSEESRSTPSPAYAAA
jgi:outer membrane protein OmpA-like peptidoglycan-associated protein